MTDAPDTAAAWLADFDKQFDPRNASHFSMYDDLELLRRAAPLIRNLLAERDQLAAALERTLDECGGDV